ncbi:hypothetical protein D3C84_1024470 [compost metagenome]
MGAIEVGILDRIGKVDGVAADKIERGVAVDLLVGEGETMACGGVFASQAVGSVINGSGHGLAIVPGVIKVTVEEYTGLLQVHVAIVLVPGVTQL